jgi:Zn-finger protein
MQRDLIMEEHNKKNEIVKAMTDVEYYPAVFDEQVSIAK